MTKRGPASAPSALQKLRGTPKSRINENEPEANLGVPDPPSSMTDEALEVWEYTVEELRYMNVLSLADRDSLACYCEAVAIHRRASEILAFEGLMIEGRDGKMVKNPVVQLQKDAASTMKTFAVEFGLTPRARADIKVDKKDPNDEFRQLLS
jgi:P27 family predicted phage terminase small subunit